jgi:dTDP-D-glucose 4,6-dehydratase
VHGATLQGEQRRSVVDPRKIGKIMGWKPKTSLQDGLRKTMQFFREEEAASPAIQQQPA